jgi:hypothetical protein
MKVETTDTKQFKPFELVITIESKEELNALHLMTQMNISIPELFSDEYSDLVKLFLDETRNEFLKRV